MRSRVIFGVKLTAFVCLLSAAVLLLGMVAVPKDDLGEFFPATFFTEFYQLPKNSVDVLFFGSSHGQTAFDPVTLYDEWGILSYNLSGAQHSMFLNAYWLEEAFKYQQPSAVVLETYFLFNYDLLGQLGQTSPLNMNAPMLQAGLHFMRPSLTSLRASLDIQAVAPDESWVNYFLPGIRYHDRVRALSQTDLDLGRFSRMEGPLGFIPLVDEVDYETYEPLEVLGYTQPETIPPLMLKYLDRIRGLCRQNGAELILVCTPAVGQSPEKSLATQQYADANGLRFIDFNDSRYYYSELAYDFLYDNSDVEHPNVWGAEKLTNYMGMVLCDEMGLEGGSEHSLWEAARERRDARIALTEEWMETEQ